MLWPEQGLTFTFCRKRVCHLKWATGNNLVPSVESASFNLLGELRKSAIGLISTRTRLNPVTWNYHRRGFIFYWVVVVENLTFASPLTQTSILALEP